MKKVLLIIILLITRVLMSQTDVEINSYYQEISSKSEYGIKKEKCKFLKDVKIFVQGNPDDTMNFELNKILSVFPNSDFNHIKKLNTIGPMNI